MIEAHSLAEVTPQQIQYLELHGSGTPLGDAIEFAVASNVCLGRQRRMRHRGVWGL